jgi:pyruvate dehydrogenase E2 component (dihydrolipoamide acetyltransferase)
MTGIVMPALSPTMEAGTLARWLVTVGDSVSSGDVIAEIETDKATMELEAAVEGIVAELLVQEGAEDVAVGTPILRFTDEGEVAASSPASATAAARPPSPAPAPAAPDVRSQEPPVAPPMAVAASVSDVDATALGRKLAVMRGIDLAKLPGAQVGRRVMFADVAAAAGLQAATPTPTPAQFVPPASPSPAPAPAPLPEPAPGEASFETERLSNMRKTIARRLTESKQQVPHFYLTIDIVLDPLLALRAELNQALVAEGMKLSVNDMVLKAQALALMQVPDTNVSFTADGLRRFQRADISVAVALPGGLITPVIRDAGSKSLSTVAAEMKDLAARAKAGKLQPAEYTGGTASLSNLGMFGIKQFDAVINPPEAMILAIGAGEQRAHVVEGALTVATVMSATGSFDHRAIDGAAGAEFMAAFKALIENPWRMLA